MASTIHPGNVLTMLEYTRKKKQRIFPHHINFHPNDFSRVFRVLALKPMSGFPRSADTIQTVSYALSLGISNWTLGLNVDL